MSRLELLALREQKRSEFRHLATLALIARRSGRHGLASAWDLQAKLARLTAQNAEVLLAGGVR